MADKAISELAAVEQIKAADMFVLEQDGSAKKLTGQVLLNWLTAAADGHGGVQSIIKTGSSGLVDTYTITLADQTKQTFTVTNGDKGDKGDNSYVWIKYASKQPTSTSVSLSDIPDNWMGIYSGNLNYAPSIYSQYKWFEIKGKQGDQGEPGSLDLASVQYQVSTSGTVVPSGAWSNSIPSVPQGRYLWTRVMLQFNQGADKEITFYSVSRIGVDGTGTGTVTSVNGVSPNSNGDVALTPSDIGAAPSNNATITGYLNVPEPQDSSNAATKGYVDGRYWSVSVTLLKSGWSNNRQTVTVTGVSADETQTDVMASPDPADSENRAAYMDNDVYIIQQQDGAVMFACDSVPDRDLTVNVAVIIKGETPSGVSYPNGDDVAYG